MTNPALDLSDVAIRQQFIARTERHRELMRLIFWLAAILAGAVGAGLIVKL